ncbi:MAG TPA: hypothetical protein VG984_02415 [Candidatus Paceibacterota bacterium]|nr:hypothetical protein [Candidatus Paceibacterota bacterium]
MSKKHQMYIGGTIIIVAVAGASFWSGMAYAHSKTSARGQFGMTQFGGGTRFGMGMGTGGAGMRGGGIAQGEIVNATGPNLTIKLQNGSTQLVVLGSSTSVQKSVLGTTSDLTSGQNVIVTGTTNSDGSITAQSVQIRPSINR